MPWTLYNIANSANSLAGVGVYNVKIDFGAKGDGATDDSFAIQAALTAARVNGGGIVFVPPGTYMVSMTTPHPLFAGYYPCLIIGANTMFAGAGRDVSIIKLISGQVRGNDLANNNSLLLNYNGLVGDESSTIQDLTFDGNAANQTHTHAGIGFIRPRGWRHFRLRVKNCRGTTSGGGPNETFFYETQLGADTSYTDCEAVTDAGTTAGGFSADIATNVTYNGCWAWGMTNSNGFTHNTCQNIQYVNCRAQKNGLYGFNSEVSVDVSYVNCMAGGISVTTGSAPYPYASNTSLGNTGHGFTINTGTRAQLIGCISRKNGNQGATFVTSSSARVVGGEYSDNTTFGLGFDATSAPLSRVTGGPIITGNTTANLSITLGNSLAYGNVAGPAVPATTVAAQNPYPFDATAYIVGGTVTVVATSQDNVTYTTIATATSATLPLTVRIPAGAYIKMTFSVAPTWKWWID